MPIGWFLAPYKLRLRDGKPPRRYCAMDDFSAEVDEWGEVEIHGNLSIVRVRARAEVLRRVSRGSDVALQRVEDPVLYWTPERSAPALRGGEMVFSRKTKRMCNPLSKLLMDVLDDTQQSALLRRAEALAREADQRAYYRMRGYSWELAAKLLCLLGKMGYGLSRVSTGTFPTTSLLDNFDRASLGANWSTDPYAAGQSALTITSNQASSSDGAGCSWYNVATYGGDCEVYIVIATKPSAGDTEIGLRTVSVGTIGVDGYDLECNVVAGAGNDLIEVNRIDNQTFTQLGASITQEWAGGDSFGLEAIGSVLTAYYKSGAGSWSAIGNRTDATYSAAGYLTLMIESTDARVDDFSGGTVVAGQPTMPRWGGVPGMNQYTGRRGW